MAFQLSTVSKGERSGILLTDYRFLIRELNKIDPQIARGLRASYRQIAAPAQAAVKSAISNRPITSGIHRNDPNRVVSGFYPKVIPGRVTWGTGKPARSVLVETKTPKLKNKGFNSIARLRVGSAATVIADMAGTKNNFSRKQTRVYDYSRAKSGQRSHRNNGQGLGMVRALNRVARASRFIWPAFDKAAPAVQIQGKLAINAVVDLYNAELRKSVS